MHTTQSDSTSDVEDVAGGQAVGTVTPGSTGDIKLPLSKAPRLRSASCQGAAFCCKQKKS